MLLMENKPLISISKSNVIFNILRFYGELFDVIKQKREITLTELQRTLSRDVARFVKREKIASLLGLLRVIQMTRLVSLSFEGWRRDKVKVAATGLIDTLPQKPQNVTPEQYATAIFWGYMAKQQYITGKIVEKVLRDKPGELTSIALPENPSLYDKVLTDIYSETIRTWPKSIGSVRGTTDYVNIFKPLTDVALFLTLAGITGYLLLNAKSIKSLAEYYERKKAPRRLHNALDSVLGRNFMEPRYFSENVRENRELPEKTPLWQKLAFEIAQKP